MKTRLLILLLAFSTVGLFSQQKSDSILNIQTDFTKSLSENNIEIDISHILLFKSTSVNYEGLIYRSKSMKNSFYIKIGVGYFMSCFSEEHVWDGGLQIPISFTYLSGGENNHFEADLGGRCVFIYDYIYPYPILNLGYRYQRPGNGVYFKALAGTDGLTLGVGYAF